MAWAAYKVFNRSTNFEDSLVVWFFYSRVKQIVQKWSGNLLRCWRSGGAHVLPLQIGFDSGFTELHN